MFPRFVSACFLLVSMVFCSTAAFAGRVELTTYYPAPHGEYTSITASQTLKVPVKTVGDDTNQVTAGEIWIEG